MSKVKVLVAIAGLVAAFGIAAACSNGEASTSSDGDIPDVSQGAPTTPGGEVVSPPVGATEPAVGSTEPTVGATEPTVGAPVSEVVASPPVGPAPAIEPSFAPASGSSRAVGAPQLQTGNSQAGIWVTGEGAITLEPDLALLNVGVEATRKTVVEARNVAARAMEAIVAVLHARGIENKDIRTRFFSISPRYEFREVVEEGFRTNRQVLVGYMVNNSASIKIRDMDETGTIIDEVAAAGGDAVRINGISFTVEDPKPFMAQLREAAVKDALAKAQQFASLTEVSLGRLVFISESGAAPVARDFARAEFSLAAAAAPTTPISGGQLELRMSVQAVFDIL